MSETEQVAHIGDQMPRVGSVSHHGAYEIVVSWAAGPRERKADIVDLAPVVLTHKFFRPLRDNPEMLKTVHVIDDGAAIAWGDDDTIDMAATTIERLAEETMDSADFRAWLERHKFTYDAAAAQLGISRRLVAYYASKRHVPRYIALACRYLDRELVPDSSAFEPAAKAAAAASGPIGLVGRTALEAIRRSSEEVTWAHVAAVGGALGKGSSSSVSPMLEALRQNIGKTQEILEAMLLREEGVLRESFPTPREFDETSPARGDLAEDHPRHRQR